MVEVDLDHQYAKLLVVYLNRCGKVVAAFSGGRALAEKAPELALHRFAEIGAEGKVTSDKTIAFIPVRRRNSVTMSIHQVHDFSAGLAGDFTEQLIGFTQGLRAFRVSQQLAQVRQLAQNLRQHLIAMQRAQQVGHVQVERLAVLPGQFAAVIALGQVLQRPQQRRQAQRQ